MDTAKQLVWVGRAAAVFCFLSGAATAVAFSGLPIPWELIDGIRSICSLLAFIMILLVVMMTPKVECRQVDQTIGLVLLADLVGTILVALPVFSAAYMGGQTFAYATYFRVKLCLIILCWGIAAFGILRGWRFARWATIPILVLYLGMYFPVFDPDFYLAPPVTMQIASNPPQNMEQHSSQHAVIVPISMAEQVHMLASVSLVGIIVFYLFALRGRASLGDRLGLGEKPAT